MGRLLAILTRRRGRVARLVERRTAELRAERDFSAGVLASLQDGLAVVDREGCLIQVNRRLCEMTGFSREELVGCPPPFPYHPPEHWPQIGARLTALLESGGSGEAELVFRRRDGTRFPVLVTSSPLVGEDGRTRGAVRVMRDLSERRAVERLKDEFVALVSHELRTPLTSILGYLELLREDAEQALGPEQHEFLEVIDRNARHLVRLVGDVLVVAQADAGRLELRAEPLDLAALARARLTAHLPAAEAAGVRLESRLHAAPVSGDPDRLAQVLDNLIANAIRFTPAGGRAVVRVGAGGGRARLAVADTGVGIAAAEQGRVFERFYRASSATRSHVKGTGLGLAIARMVVEAHGGAIRLRSAEGRGTVFRVSLPAAPATAAAEAAAAG